MKTELLVGIIIVETIIILAVGIKLIWGKRSNQSIIKRAKEMENGHLDVEDIPLDKQEKDSAIIASAFNTIKSNLMTFVEATKSNVVVLSDAIMNLADAAEENKSDSTRMSQQVNNISVKTDEQLLLVKENLRIIESNNVQVDDINSSMNIMKDVLNDTVTISKSGIENLEGYEKDMDVVSQDLNRIDEVLKGFNDDIQRIEEVGDFIISISEELNLLSLNASIEAARVGSVGKGFAVVAGEMNEMATKTQEGISTINQIVAGIIESSQQVNDSILDCESTFNASKNTFTQVNSSFRTINRNASDLQEQIHQITDKMSVINQNSAASKQKASNLYAASNVISESTNDMTEISERTAREADALKENVIALDNMLAGIQNLLKQLNTAVTPVAKSRQEKVRILAMSMLDNDFWYGVRRGIRFAEKELDQMNVQIQYVALGQSGMDLDDEVLEVMERAIEEGVDAIVLPGFLGGINPQLKQAIAAGIKIVAYNCDFAADIKRLACFSSDSEQCGVLAGKAVEKYLGKKGKIAILSGEESNVSYVDRRDKFVNYMNKKGGYQIVATKEVSDNAELTYNTAKEMIQKSPDLQVLYVVTGTPLMAVKAVEDCDAIGKVAVVCFDHSPEIFAAIRKGTIAAAVGQDAFGQGHDPIIWAYNHIVTGEKLPSEQMICRLSVVDKDNVEAMVN